ncbi:MAG: protein TolQ [Bdellovibrionales bacterium]|nr:protein TolQ [Bdellovibrionales bacterium]
MSFQTTDLSSKGINFLEAILSASIIVQITFLILLVMSIVSWAIIFQKYAFFKFIKKSNLPFENIFLKDGSFEDIYSKARSNENSPLACIFIGGYNEMQKILKNSKSSVPTLKGLDNIERALRKECEKELSEMENSLNFLATVGSSGPFIGLFGTVFGIMNSFNKIAIMGSASLNVVAPGIAEALLATGVGLFAAIPASIFYNNYLGEVKKFELLFNNFTTDFLNVTRRNFFHDKNDIK